jgi:hypothetical protein
MGHIVTRGANCSRRHNTRKHRSMIYILLVFAFIAIALIGYLLYALHERVEKISKNQAIMVQWCDTIRQNEEQLINDFKKVKYECQSIKKET